MVTAPDWWFFAQTLGFANGSGHRSHSFLEDVIRAKSRRVFVDRRDNEQFIDAGAVTQPKKGSGRPLQVAGRKIGKLAMKRHGLAVSASNAADRALKANKAGFLQAGSPAPGQLAGGLRRLQSTDWVGVRQTRA